METIKINLSGHYLITPGTRKLYKIFGFVFLSFGVFSLVFTIVKKEVDITILSIISNLIFGLYFLIIGFRIFQNSFNEYIKINDQQIIYKPYFFKKPRIVRVEDIREITIAPLAINFKFDHNDFRINLRWVSYKTVRKTKEAIKTIVSSKQIKITE
ncbi:MAG: hypothetical protein KAT38_10530 [Bacteroidales bacterium]|nr:hypothetical protein [Bacteroidales bacterium]